MSWDVQINAATAPPPIVEEMPDDWKGLPLGPPDDVRRKISTVFPGTKWDSDGAWGSYSIGNLFLEFDLGNDQTIESLGVHVHGSGDPVSLLLGLCNRYDWYLLDYSAGEWMHHMPDTQSGWQSFQDYRDQLTEGASSND